ncbi:MAG: glycosyl hydrolase, partial [Verrucomicrobiota bacterium]
MYKPVGFISSMHRPGVRLKFVLSIWLLLGASLIGFGQIPVQVGAGSYASSIPPGPTEFWAGQIVNVKNWHDTVPLFVMEGLKPPYPTNKWWSPLLFHNNVEQSNCLWAHPLNLTVERYGVGFHFADTWSGAHGAYKETFFIENPKPLGIKGRDFVPVEQRVKSWGDWTVQFRVLATDGKSMDVTMGHGIPCAWFEFNGISSPRIDAPGAECFDLDGKPVTLPFKGDHLGIQWEGRSYGLFAPDDTVFSMENGSIELSMPSEKKFVTVAALQSRDRLAYFRKYAFAVPRNSKVSWNYDAEGGKLVTDWTLETEPLKGTEHAVIQGWLPHHWRNTQVDFDFNGDEYLTARGRMRCASGTSFRITYDFNGVLTQLPAPEQRSFDRGRMNGYLNAFAGWNNDFNPETYAGGKQVAMFARELACARGLNHSKVPVLKSKLRGELENFLTYKEGKPNKFFAYSERIGGLIGFQCGFGSHRFNDQHFHYGYYVYAAGILSLFDKDFALKYGDMAKLVAKTYANWDRSDGRFPFFRTLDLWEGHSWASGGPDNSPFFGENQESSSEAMMSWAGVVTLGNALSDSPMTAAGIFGYVMESAAVNEYWFNRHNENFPKDYGPPGTISCITWSNQIQYITYFGPEPIFVHGIQYLPILPSSYYLVRYPEAAATEFHTLITNSASERYTRFKTRDSWEGLWAAEVMRYASLFDPAWASEWFEQLWKNKDPKANDAWESGLTYYFIEANKGLGAMQWDSHIAAPNSGVFYNAGLKQYTYCAFNPSDTPKSYKVYKAGKIVGELKVPAHSFYSAHDFDGSLPPVVSIDSPAEGLIVRIPGIVLNAKASSPGGVISKVEFYDGNELLGTLARPPFTLRVEPLKDGPHAFVARAYDDKGLSTYSETISVTCDLPVQDILFDTRTPDFSARMTGKSNPTITFIPGKSIANCGYVDILVKLNDKDAGAFRMKKTGGTFTQTLNAGLGDKITCSFTYQTPPTGERNTHASPCS